MPEKGEKNLQLFTQWIEKISLLSSFCKYKDWQGEKIILMDKENVSRFFSDPSLAAFDSRSLHNFPSPYSPHAVYSAAPGNEWALFYKPTACLFPATSSQNRLSNLLCFYVHARMELCTPTLLDFSLIFSLSTSPASLEAKDKLIKADRIAFSEISGGHLCFFFLLLKSDCQ